MWVCPLDGWPSNGSRSLLDFWRASSLSVEASTHLSYFEMPDAERLALSQKITALGNGSLFPAGDRLVGVAIARGMLGETNALMTEHGFSYERS